MRIWRSVYADDAHTVLPLSKIRFSRKMISVCKGERDLQSRGATGGGSSVEMLARTVLPRGVE